MATSRSTGIPIDSQSQLGRIGGVRVVFGRWAPGRDGQLTTSDDGDWEVEESLDRQAIAADDVLEPGGVFDVFSGEIRHRCGNVHSDSPHEDGASTGGQMVLMSTVIDPPLAAGGQGGDQEFVELDGECASRMHPLGGDGPGRLRRLQES